MDEYTQKVIDHAENPRNFGSLDKPDGVGRVESQCGDWVQMEIKLGEKGMVADAKFQCWGCANALATSSVITEMAIGKNLEDLEKITTADVIAYLGGVPQHKTHCSELSVGAFQEAIKSCIRQEA